MDPAVADVLVDKAGAVPRVGTTVELQGIRFTVKRATPQVIQEVQITR